MYIVMYVPYSGVLVLFTNIFVYRISLLCVCVCVLLVSLVLLVRCCSCRIVLFVLFVLVVLVVLFGDDMINDVIMMYDDV